MCVWRNRSVFLLTCLCWLQACTAQECRLDLPGIPLSINGKSLTVEVAATPAARQCGLSHRDVLDSDRGMLFVFEHDQKLHFWMKDTAVPLSIVYIDANRTIREHHDLKPYFTELVSSETLLRYALEANRGWFDDNKIKPGDKVTFALPEGMVTRP